MKSQYMFLLILALLNGCVAPSTHDEMRIVTEYETSQESRIDIVRSLIPHDYEYSDVTQFERSELERRVKQTLQDDSAQKKGSHLIN